MMDGLDIVAIGVEGKGGVVAGMIRPLAGRAVVAAARGQHGGMEAVDRGAVLGLR
jgi:hypothetical protein